MNRGFLFFARIADLHFFQGWGIDNETSRSKPDILQHVDLTVIDDVTCQEGITANAGEEVWDGEVSEPAAFLADSEESSGGFGKALTDKQNLGGFIYASWLFGKKRLLKRRNLEDLDKNESREIWRV